MIRISFQFYSTLLAGLSLWFSACLLTSPVYSQVPKGGSAEMDRLVEKVREGKFDRLDLRKIVRAGAVQATPALETQFKTAVDPSLQEALASALISLGERQQIYWDFLAAKAETAIDNAAPHVNDFDSQGNTIRRRLSPKFLEWAQANRLEPQAAAEAQVYGLPGHVFYLAFTGDPRGQTILRKGLFSQNYFIRFTSAEGLALLQDKDSIPLSSMLARRCRLKWLRQSRKRSSFSMTPRHRTRLLGSF